MSRLALLFALLVPCAAAHAQRDALPVADAYGYTVSRSPAPACPAAWIDTATGTALTLTAASVEAPADDDGGAALALPLPFEFYGEAHSNVVVSSNGYLAFADDLAAEDGGHWRSDCPLPAIPDNTLARFARVHPLLADLERGVSGDLRWQHFADCPRDAAQAADACTVVTWLGWKRRDVVGVLDLQVVLYHGSGEIVLQYGALDAAAAAGATVGIQDGGASSAAMPSCGDMPAAEASSAICFAPPGSVLPTFSIQTSASPPDGGSTSGDGDYASNTPVTVIATPATGYGFVDWRENDVVQSTSASYGFTATADRTLVASFALNQYTIAASANPAAGGSVGGTGTFLHGDTVTVVATPASGYRFVDWRENDIVQSASASYAFPAERDRTLVALFEADDFEIAAIASPAQGGSIEGAGTYLRGQNAVLEAIPDPGYAFVNWTEGAKVVSTDATLIFEVQSDRSLQANFVALPDTMFGDGFESP
jgi:hypothetical protein